MEEEADIVSGAEGACVKSRKALGLGYWILFWPVLILMLALGTGLLVDHAYVFGSLFWVEFPEG